MKTMVKLYFMVHIFCIMMSIPRKVEVATQISGVPVIACLMTRFFHSDNMPLKTMSFRVQWTMK